MLFGGIEQIIKVIIMTILLYFSIVVIIRVSGKRTLGDLNAFDMLVTISMGSIAATNILSKDTEYLEGIVSISTLVILQYIIARLITKSEKLKHLVKAKPTILYIDGEYLEENMVKMRITKSDILQQARIDQGATSNKIEAVLIESNGKLSIITNLDDTGREELKRYI